jgi:hypothetical protein
MMLAPFFRRKLFSDPHQNIHRRKPRTPVTSARKQRNTEHWSSHLETLSALLLPITLLALLSLIVWGPTESTWFAVQPELHLRYIFARHSHEPLAQPHLEFLRPAVNVPMAGGA